MTKEGVDMLSIHEGYRRFPYKDTKGILTIGIGFNLDEVGLSEEESKVILKMRTDKIGKELNKYSWYSGLNEVRKDVICNMVYNMGIGRVLKFKGMIRSIILKDFEMASKEMLYKDGKDQSKGKSPYYEDVKGRALELATLMVKGCY
jgi:lysozyme